MQQTGGGRRWREAERGASLVEFALVVPLLTMFLFGIVQFGIAYDKQQSINSGAREGARLGALGDSTLADIADRAVEASELSAVGNDPTVTVADDAGAIAGTRQPGGTYTGTNDATAMPCGRPTPSAYVHVSVSTPYDITIPLFGVHTVTIDAEAEFRCE